MATGSMAPNIGNVPPVNRPRLFEVVLEHLTRQILSGDLKQGDALPSEEVLANLFHVSKPTVRDALRHLSALGIVEIRQGRPSSIGEVRPDSLSSIFRFMVANAEHRARDVIQLRRAIDCSSAGLAAENVTDEEIAELRRILAKLGESKYDHDGWTYWDARLHVEIARASRNAFFPIILEALLGLMQDTIRLLFTRQTSRDPEKTYRRHVDIVEAIAARDKAAAIRAMEEHFDASLTLLNMMSANHEGEEDFLLR